MAKCQRCGNEYDKAFEVRMADDKGGIFDSFECAIHELAPRCRHCDCTILGHGVEANGSMFCCAHCAREAGIKSLADRA